MYDYVIYTYLCAAFKYRCCVGANVVVKRIECHLSLVERNNLNVLTADLTS